MKIVINRPTRVDGKSVDIGAEVDTDKKTAEFLFALGKARPVTKPKAKADK